ncbi:regulatory protein, luxR family [Micromonospora pallida]|uniref:Regulatory protein, luxR family n=1 Tax=Micromonospora pallida TaxID=145854 RepID=A0A1C6SDY8_9ACTN|nr:helix-turn-helix transcriptional regulator [Micromonospora pallida]SCL27692.1 regulatory protein, luxR family [Micromonospora pallida]
MTAAILRPPRELPVVLDGPSRALLDAVAADPAAPLAATVVGPGGHGKSTLLREVARAYRDAGASVLPVGPDTISLDQDSVLLVDDAQALNPARLRELRALVGAEGCRMVVAYRPWPRPASLVELSDALGRDGRSLPLCPFTRQQTTAYLAGVPELRQPSTLADFVQAQTGGVPRDVDRLVRALREQVTAPPDDPGRLEVPEAAVLGFGPELADLDSGVRQLLLALAAGVPLPADLLGVLLDGAADRIDELSATAKAAGLLGPDDRLAPLVRRAVAALSPTAERGEIWLRLTELQLARGGPLLPLVRALHRAGVTSGCPAGAAEAAAEEALSDDPGLAAELLAVAAAAGRPAAGRQARAAALAGDLDSALRLADRLVADPADPAVRAEAAAVAATALVHRGHLGRAVELYRWSGSASSMAFAAIGAIGTGQPDAATPPPDGPPTLLASATSLMAEGTRESLTNPANALATFVQASALLEPTGRAVLLPDSPAALAALVAAQSGELDIGERVLDRAMAHRTGGPLLARRHRLLQAWILMVRGRTAAAAESLATAAHGGPMESRDLLFATALEVGIARRESDLPALRRSWERAVEAIVRHAVDLFTLLPLGEFAIAAARLGDLERLSPYLSEAYLLLDRLGNPALWTVPLHWSGLHAAILTEESATADDHVAALARMADQSRYAAAVSVAAHSWVEVLRGVVDQARVEAAAQGLHGVGLGWDAARLAGQAAIRTADRRAMTALLECARMLHGRPAGATDAASGRGVGADAFGPADVDRLSGREQEVAELVLAGLTYKQIGDQLFISAKTVEHHVARMRSRLNCASRSELLARLRSIVPDRGGSAPGRGFPPARG